LRAIVVTPNGQIRDVGSILAVARAEARKREHSIFNPVILALQYLPEIDVYVAVYDENEIPKHEPSDSIF
jgi:hypothetical protein